MADLHLPIDPDLLVMIRRCVVALILYLLIRVLATRLVRSTGRAYGHDPDRIRGMLAMVNRGLGLLFLVIMVAVLGVWDNLSVYLGSLLAIIGVALFAHWSLLSNLTAGFLLFGCRDLRHGDRIRVVDGDNSLEGRIVEFRLMSLVLRQDDGRRVICPNNLIIQKPFVCLSLSQESAAMAVSAEPPRDPRPGPSPSS